MKLLFIGDIMGSAGRNMVKKHLPALRRKYEVDIVVANGENMAGGFGITIDTFQEITQAGVDVVTGGNHSFDKKEGVEVLENEPYCLRPANYPSKTPGQGHVLYTNSKGQKLGIINVMGRVFMDPLDDPFRVAEECVEKLSKETKVIMIDLHAEATSEKVAFAWNFDGRVSFIVGTHTHVPTGDERIFPDGLAFQCDAGMTGPYDSVIGVKKEIVLQKFLTKRGRRFEVADGMPWLCGVFVEIDEETGKAQRIERIRIEENRPETHP